MVGLGCGGEIEGTKDGSRVDGGPAGCRGDDLARRGLAESSLKLGMGYISKRGCQEAAGCEFGGQGAGFGVHPLWMALESMGLDGWSRRSVHRGKKQGLGPGIRVLAGSRNIEAEGRACHVLRCLCSYPSQLGSHLWATGPKGAEWELDLSVKTHCRLRREKSLKLYICMISKSVGL